MSHVPDDAPILDLPDRSSDLQGSEDAIVLLRHLNYTPEHWRVRAMAHISQADPSLRPLVPIDNEQMFQAMLKDTANELRMAGAALEQAAQALIGKQFITLGKQAHGASQRALKAAEGLVGS